VFITQAGFSLKGGAHFFGNAVSGKRRILQYVILADDKAGMGNAELFQKSRVDSDQQPVRLIELDGVGEAFDQVAEQVVVPGQAEEGLHAFPGYAVFHMTAFPAVK